MRTTLTLDEDVAAKLKAEVRRTGRSWKEVVNETLRLGLLAKRSAKPREPFRIQARAWGVRPGLDYDRIAELVDQVEGCLHR